MHVGAFCSHPIVQKIFIWAYFVCKMVILIVSYKQFDIEKSITATASFACCSSKIFVNFCTYIVPLLVFLRWQLQVAAIWLQLEVEARGGDRLGRFVYNIMINCPSERPYLLHLLHHIATRYISATSHATRYTLHQIFITMNIADIKKDLSKRMIRVETLSYITISCFSLYCWGNIIVSNKYIT